MLNYIFAELYKLRRKKSLFIGMAVLLALESLAFTPAFWLDDTPMADVLLVFLDSLLPLGVFLAPVFAVLAFDNQDGHGTLKNEVVFGIPRSRAYLGKLLAGMLAGTLAAAAVVGWYLLLCALRVGPSLADVPWGQMIIDVSSAWLTWLAASSFAMFLLFFLRSTTGAMILAYLLTSIGFPVAMMGAGEGAAPWVKLAVELFYAAPYQRFWLWWATKSGQTPPIHWAPLWHAMVVCALWVGGFTALGLACFHRREIK